jgi:hypothetical protein
MDYVYVGIFSCQPMKMLTDEIRKHLNKYKELFGLPKIICIDSITRVNANNENYICDYGINLSKKKVLTYIIFETNATITFYINNFEINCEPNTIVIFPAEWFFPFKITPAIINIGNVFVDI